MIIFILPFIIFEMCLYTFDPAGFGCQCQGTKRKLLQTQAALKMFYLWKTPVLTSRCSSWSQVLWNRIPLQDFLSTLKTNIFLVMFQISDYPFDLYHLSCNSFSKPHRWLVFISDHINKSTILKTQIKSTFYILSKLRRSLCLLSNRFKTRYT